MKRKKHRIEGHWRLTAREGQDAPREATRTFHQKVYVWNDWGRKPITQHGYYWITGNRLVTRQSLRVDGATEELYLFNISADDELVINRKEPTVGQISIYRRVE